MSSVVCFLSESVFKMRSTTFEDGARRLPTSFPGRTTTTASPSTGSITPSLPTSSEVRSTRILAGGPKLLYSRTHVRPCTLVALPGYNCTRVRPGGTRVPEKGTSAVPVPGTWAVARTALVARDRERGAGLRLLQLCDEVQYYYYYYYY